MKRKHYVRRGIALTFLFIFLQSFFEPYYAQALTNGPNQPEYISFESPNSSSMVETLTGDFSYSIPALEVPGPEGSFSLPLFYHGGIGLEQEASWVGLGWNINVGSISRNVSGYPDDAYDNRVVINAVDPGGSAYFKNYVLFNKKWDSQKGAGYGINLLDIQGIEWDRSGIQNVSFMGTKFNKSGVQSTWEESVFGFARAMFSVLTLGTSSGLAEGATSKLGMLETAVSIGGPLFQGYLSHGAFSSKYYEWDTETTVSHLGFRQDSRYWLDDTRTEHAFGALYLGSTHKADFVPTIANSDLSFSPSANNAPRIFNTTPGDPNNFSTIKSFKAAYGSNSKIASSDMYTQVNGAEKYSDVTKSTHIAFDNFNVMSTGISGNITPYRVEIGSLSQPKRYTLNSSQHNIIPFLEEGTQIDKVQFLYNGQFANKYLYHDDTDFGVNHSKLSSFSGVYYGYTTNKLTTARNENDREGLVNRKIVSGKNIEWFTNEEIASGAPMSQGKFIDGGYISLANRSALPPKGIGGFSITREDGTTYHYSLPVYRNQEVLLSGVKGDEENKYSKSVDNSKVAMSWLLTAITGPDFIDRGQVGQIDDSDWGYWIKFDYGLTTANYHWRNPYVGYFDDGASLTYSVGTREEYYLNSIETRSHQALFIKDFRNDRRGAYSKKMDPNFGHNTESLDNISTSPTSSMKLDRIILIEKEAFNSLTALGFSKSGNLPSEYQTGGSYFALNDVYDLYDLNRNSSYMNLINKRALKQVKFVYETDPAKQLCNKTINSFSGLPSNAPYVDAADIYSQKEGKLTLKRLEILGRGQSKLFPDYVFEYANNPDYQKDKWDGWGYYSSTATPNGFGAHITSAANINDGAAWSLTSILTPQGSKITVKYGRDDYSSVSGNAISGYKVPLLDLNLSDGESVANLSGFSEGEKVDVNVYVKYSCRTNNTLSTLHGTIMNNKVVLSQPYTPNNQDYCSDGGSATISSADVVKLFKPGGDIRVEELAVLNELGVVSKTKYNYRLSTGTSTGVVAKEPEFIRDVNDNSEFYKLYDYPFTPVLYGRVEVFSGYNPGNDTYSTKQEYSYETPYHWDVTEYNNMIYDYVVPNFVYAWQNPVYLKHYFNRVDIGTSRIGKLRSVYTFDNRDLSLISSTEFNYSFTSQDNIGNYTSGSILSEFVASGGQYDPYVMKFIRTVKKQNPYVLNSIVSKNYKSGFVNTTNIKAWDFLTGIETITENKPSIGISTRTEKILAYKVYPEMGPKLNGVSNKNMLSQTASNLTYRLDNAGNQSGLIGASSQTWNKTWNTYRVLNSGSFSNSTDGNDVWRKSATFDWIGNYSRLKSDGTQVFGASDKFDFATNATNNYWQFGNKVVRYDHFSMPLESIDNRGISSAQKMGYDNRLVLASATNAKYEEIAFSSAEDFSSVTSFFGGEVGKGNGTVLYKSKGQTTTTHTGDAVVSIANTTDKSFIFKGTLQAGKRYRASVWTNSTNGRIYYKYNGGADVLSAAPAESMRVGNWYLLHFEMPTNISPITSFEVGVKSFSGTVLFDDFRFQPMDAAMTCYVKMPLTYEHDGVSSLFEYVLDNDNLYTKYEYNTKGEMIRTYRESLRFGEKLVSESKVNYRRNNTNQ